MAKKRKYVVEQERRKHERFLHENATWVVKLYARREWKTYREEHWNENEHGLDAERMTHIREWCARRAVEGIEEVHFPNHYEIGHKFVAEHVIDALKTKLGLADSDVQRLRTLLGGRRYRPSINERLKMAEAARQIHGIQSDNREKLFEALKEEFKYLEDEENKMGETKLGSVNLNDPRRMQTDMFRNAIAGTVAGLIKTRCSNFEQLSAELEEMAKYSTR